MEWPGQQTLVPVVLNSTRPGRNRGRLNSEHPNHQTVYFTDQNGMLVPAIGTGGGRHGRSSSVSGPFPAGGTVVINNRQHQEQSPSPSPRRRRHSSTHHHDRSSSSSDDSFDSRDDRRRRGRHHEHHHRHHSHVRESRTPSPYYDSETEKRLEKLKSLEKKEEEEEMQRKFEEEQILKEARKAKKKKEEEELRKKAIEEYEIKKLEEKAKAEEKKKKEDKAFRERTIETFKKAGYSEESIEKLLEKAEKKKHKGGGGKDVMDLSRPTYIKVHKKYLSVETLDDYKLPWGYDERDEDYIIIKRWIPERDQDILFEHTRKLRERKQITDATIEIKKNRDNLMLVRKKSSPSRARSKSRPRSWMFT